MLLSPLLRRWTELACHGNPPPPRSGHQAFAKDGGWDLELVGKTRPGCVYIFGGWNNEQQFNDLFMLDIENKASKSSILSLNLFDDISCK